MSSLDKKHRPKTLNSFVGNTIVIKRLKSLLTDKESFPSAILFQGPRGCGKTSLSRVIPNKLGISEILELNIGSQRGIDHARNLEDNVKYSSIAGGGKFIILDECFAKSTKVATSKGNKQITDIKIGDIVHNLNGQGVVKNIFKNQVSLDRVVKLNFKTSSIVCSTEHLFLTNHGWTMAKDLTTNHLTLKINYSKMIDIDRKSTLIKGDSNVCAVKEKKYQKMQILPISIQNKIKKTEVLFNELPQQGKQKASYRHMQKLSNNIQYKKTWDIYKEVLQHKMCHGVQEYLGRMEKRMCRGRQNIYEKVTKMVQCQPTIFQEELRKNEKEQPNALPKEYRKNEKHEENKWNIKYMEWKTWWEWTIYRATNNLGYGPWMAYGSCCEYGEKKTKISNMLQNRYWKRETKNRSGSRWPWALIESYKKDRQKKRKTAFKEGVESVEIYQQGDNDESFKGIIGDKERNQGYVEFYDLEVSNHPSYYANETLVHNCHRGTVDFFNCLLKILEEPPPNVYFSLCTTNPEKLIPTIISRTKPPFIVKKLTIEEMKTLVTKIARKEKIDISGSSIMRAILTAADGIPRDALLILNSIKSIDDPQTMLEFIKDGSWDEDNKQVNELCQILLKGASYNQTMQIVSKLDGDPEDIRRGVLNYMGKVLLGSNNMKAAMIIEHFYESFWQVGRVGPIYAVWNYLNPTE